MKTDMEYVADSNGCPSCNSEEVEGSSIEVDAGYCSQECMYLCKL